jgi:hypothetical protein
MENSYLNDELTRMVRRIYENIENAKNMYDELPSVIRQNANELTQFNNTLGTSLTNALKASKELMNSYGMN